MPAAIPSRTPPRLIEWIALGMFVTIASHAMPYWLLNSVWPKLGDTGQQIIDAIGRRNTYYVLSLIVALLLAVPAPRRSGLRRGDTRGRWKTMLAIALLPVALTAIIYPFLGSPFAGAPVGMWLISPAAQDLIFLGYLYGRFAERFDARLWPGVPIDGALLLAAGFFSAWHVVNFASLPAGFVCFQLVYTFVLLVWTGITRVWTGSVLWAIGTHMGVNFLAWAL